MLSRRNRVKSLDHSAKAQTEVDTLWSERSTDYLLALKLETPVASCLALAEVRTREPRNKVYERATKQ